MTVTIKKSIAEGAVTAPPSKSMAHRSLICGAFSNGSKIGGVHNMSKDIEATLACLKGLGTNVSIDGDVVAIGGLDVSCSHSGISIYANESGSTLRFLIPIVLLFDDEITITGTKRLFERSLGIYEEMCAQRGLGFELVENGVKLRGPLQSGVFEVRGDVSSQFISGLLFALPLCKGDSIIRIVGELESASYIDLTLVSLKEFGIAIERPDSKTFLIKGNQSYKPSDTIVEGDYSNAAFFEALNFIGGSVEVSGLNPDSIQGDRVYKALFSKIEREEFPIDISDCPDLAPILFAMAAYKGRGEFVGTRRLKIKESDRAEAMKQELEKMGAEVTVGENSVNIVCSELVAPKERINGHNDHRIVMAMSVLATLTGAEIEEAEAVSKSFPDFFSRLEALGIEVEHK
ncbi:MAG: 3-phosphoshikimate 1-carboxyvinyltransferase [Clostridia bacterium]|nr:3-phosphoshikimate 1-carboxyvinyltransferase [Clostridia bacterium]